MSARRGFARIARVPSFAALAGLVLCACHDGAAAPERPAAPVRVAVAARVDVPLMVVASGVVEPVQSAVVISQVTGVIQDVAFHEGEYVRAGQVLFRVDPRPLQADVDRTRAQLLRDEAQAEAGRRDDARYQELVGKGYVTGSQADQIHANAVASRATVAADSAVLRGAQLALANATIRAPIAGRTGSLLARLGNVASPGSGPLVVINQIQPVLARFPVPQQQFESLQRAVAKHPLRVTVTAADSTRGGEVGTLSFLDNAVDSLTGTVIAKARFPNRGGYLWPGELVLLSVEVEVERGALTVPTTAIQLGQEGSFVYVVDAQSTVESRPVTEGRTAGDLTIVTAGLKAGDQVVVDGQSRLSAGARVIVQRETQ